MNKTIKNPWLKISVEDYEGHMSSPEVGQLQFLSKIFAELINEFKPESICVLGSATGNGFEHLLNRNINRITGVDINPDYISICKKRFSKMFPKLELVCADIEKVKFTENTFDLIHAALIFEYVKIGKVIGKISKWLIPNGVLSVIIQLQSQKYEPVSETQYKSLKSLTPFINFVEPDDLCLNAKKFNLELVRNYNIKLNSGKIFSTFIFVK